MRPAAGRPVMEEKEAFRRMVGQGPGHSAEAHREGLESLTYYRRTVSPIALLPAGSLARGSEPGAWRRSRKG